MELSIKRSDLSSLKDPEMISIVSDLNYALDRFEEVLTLYEESTDEVQKVLIQLNLAKQYIRVKACTRRLTGK